MIGVKIDLSSNEAQRRTYLAALRCGRIKEVIRVAEAFAAANLAGSAEALRAVARNMTGAAGRA
jgi:ribosomal protein L12E/L44/L45/RPP1/RPP2